MEAELASAGWGEAWPALDRYGELILGQSPAAYVASRDPVSGTAYALSLVLFAVMPTLVTRTPNVTSGDGKRSQGAK